MAGIGDIFLVDDRQIVPSIGLDDVHNIYFYEVIVGGTTADQIVGGFINTMMTALCGVQTNHVAHMSLEVKAITNLVDFTTYVWDIASRPVGIIGGTEMLPPHDAYSFTLKRNSRLVKDGSKRIIGVPENGVASGQITSSTLLDALDDLRNAMKAPMTLDEVEIAQPVIVKRIQKPNPKFGVVSRASKYLYDLPTSIPEATAVLVRDALFNIFIGTQDSRSD